MKSRPLRVLGFPKEGGNPYLNQLSSHLEAAGLQVDEFTFPRAFLERYDVVHIHWPDTHLWSDSWWRSLGKHIRLFVLFVLLRLRRTRIVWTLHNVRSHEKNHWIGALLFPMWVPRLCTHVISLTPSGLEMLRLIYPALRRKPAAIIPHGHYRDIYPLPPSRRECRARLGLPTEPFTFLFFGGIRRYKNVALLVEVFRKLAGRDVQLVVAGEPVKGMRAVDVEQAAAGDDRVHLFLRHIPDAEVPDILGAADLLVTPFTNVLNSGSVMLALSMNRPVLAPRVGALPDLQHMVGARWLSLYEGALEPEVLQAAREQVAGLDPDEAVDLAGFAWPAIAAATIELYTRPGRDATPSAVPAVGRAGEVSACADANPATSTVAGS